MGKSGDSCPHPLLNENTRENFIGSLSFHEFNMVLSGACMGFSMISAYSLMVLHACHYSKPNEQSKILKIINLVPLYTLYCFLSIVYPDAYASLKPWIDYFQSIALASFFLLMCEFVSPHKTEQDLFFAAMDVKRKKGEPKNGLVWFRQRWVLIFQYPVVAPIVALLTDITNAAGVYCYWESEPDDAHLWLDIVANVSVSLAVTAVVIFYAQLKNDLKHHYPLAKLGAFKLIVGLAFFQGIIFWILRDTGTLTPTSTLTYADLNIGIPTLILCLEMVPVSLFFHFAYSYRPYVIHRDHSVPLVPAGKLVDGEMVEAGIETYDSPRSYQAGFLGWRPLVALFDPREIVRGVIFATKIASEWYSRRGQEGSDQIGGKYFAPR